MAPWGLGSLGSLPALDVLSGKAMKRKSNAFFLSSHSRAENWMKHLPGTGDWEEIADLITDSLSVELVHFKRIRKL